MSDLNDPRVFFAGERTLLAWNLTALALMAFGFVIERFGLFMHLLPAKHIEHLERGVSFWVGIAFILLGSWASAAATRQYGRVLLTLRPVEIPDQYQVHNGVMTNIGVAILGVALAIYLFLTLRPRRTTLEPRVTPSWTQTA